MPRKKKTIVEETLPDREETTTDDDSPINDYVCVLTKVHKLNGSSRSFCFQSQEPVDEVTIQQLYPVGGKFVVTEYNAMSQVLETKHIEIEPSPVTNVHNGNGNGHHSMEVMLLRDELNHSRNMLTTLLAGILNNRNQQTPIGELVTAVQGMHGLVSGRDPVDLLLKGMDLANKAGGKGETDWKTEVVSGVKEVLPHAIQAFTVMRQPPMPAVTGEQPMISTTPQAAIKAGLAWLKPQILSGMQPNLAVGMLVQFANNPQYQPILATAIQGDINNFIQFDPELANEPYKTWFEVAIQLLKEWYAEQSNPDSDNDGGIGNDTDATANASVSNGKPKVK